MVSVVKMFHLSVSKMEEGILRVTTWLDVASVSAALQPSSAGVLLRAVLAFFVASF